MKTGYSSKQKITDLSLWDKARENRTLLSFDLELTARCNNDCRHCYVNLPAGDRAARDRELTVDEIRTLAGEAVELGALWCVLTGGEPMLRRDFADIYLLLRRLGLLVSLFTNAVLATDEIVDLLKLYPPRNLDVSVYGVTRETYERVTRREGSFDGFRQGLDRLIEAGLPVSLKAVPIRSNVAEFSAIAAFCRRYSVDPFRFDPLLHLRYDGDPERNREIREERLSGPEIADLEWEDPTRARVLQRDCAKLIVPGFAEETDTRLFYCDAGRNTCAIGCDGTFRLCSSLCRPDCLYDLRKGSLTDAWRHFVPSILERRSDRREYLESCHRCPIVNLCLWCPAHADLETGEMDLPVDYFCRVAHCRAERLKTCLSEDEKND